MNGADIENLIHLVFEICVVPLFMALFLLYNSVKRIELLLYKHFVTKEELARELDNVKTQRFNKTFETSETRYSHQ